MSKIVSAELCCVCLDSKLNLNKLSKKDLNKITLCKKLKDCVSEITWTSTFSICESCTNLLDISYTFRKTCLKSDQERRKKQKFELNKRKYKLENKDTSITDADNNVENVKIEIKPNNVISKQLDEEVDDSTTEFDEEKSNYKDFNRQNRKRRKHVEFTCDKCNKICNSSIKLVNHCIKEHDMKKSDVRPFICERCPSSFCNSSNLLQHVKYHDAVRNSVCTYCGKGFITKTDLYIHEKQHLNKREYGCDECGKCFNTHKDIRSHKLVVHTDSNSWKYCCGICNKPFPIKSNYDSHMRRHTGDKKFECHLCQRKFTDKCVLQRHMRTHSNIREYKCVHCKREYKDPRVLKVHMAKIHGIGLGEIKIPSREKKYFCHICPKAYYAKNKLTRHLYTHSGEKPFDCPMCGKKFNDKSYVKQHLRKTHNIYDDIENIKNENDEIMIQGIFNLTENNILNNIIA